MCFTYMHNNVLHIKKKAKGQCMIIKTVNYRK